jgi:hypothetical protein
MRRTHRLSPSLGLEAAGTAGQRDASQRLEFSLQRLTCAENRLDVVAAPPRPAAAHARGRAASRALGSGAARRAASRGRPAPRGAEANADGRAARLLPRAMARPRCSRGARTAHQHHMATREASAARACSSFTRPCATRKAPAARAAGAHASAPQAHARLPSQTGRASSMRRTTRPSAGAGRPLYSPPAGACASSAPRKRSTRDLTTERRCRRNLRTTRHPGWRRRGQRRAAGAAAHVSAKRRCIGCASRAARAA